METTLHRQLKELYADPHSRQEVPLDKYRIDVVRGDVLVEIQLGSIAAIRDKIHKLLVDHYVLDCLCSWDYKCHANVGYRKIS